MWQIDFSEFPRKGTYKYLLVLTDTFSGWPEAFPCWTNEAREIVKALVQEILPQFGETNSDRRSHFVAQVVQGVSHLLSIQWQLHTPYRPQASRQAKRMNHLIKQQWAKICQKPNFYWYQALPMALLSIYVHNYNQYALQLFIVNHHHLINPSIIWIQKTGFILRLLPEIHSRKNGKDLTIWDKTQTLHQITLGNASCKFKEIEDKLTAWLPNLSWLKQLFVTVICLVMFLFTDCITRYCYMMLGT